MALLRQQAPTWLVQMPWLLTEADRQQWRYELQGTTRERMLREFAEVLETLTAETPLLLVLEDLHWSDYATLDLLALLARRQTPARLLMLGHVPACRDDRARPSAAHAWRRSCSSTATHRSCPWRC